MQVAPVRVAALRTAGPASPGDQWAFVVEGVEPLGRARTTGPSLSGLCHHGQPISGEPAARAATSERRAAQRSQRRWRSGHIGCTGRGCTRLISSADGGEP